MNYIGSKNILYTLIATAIIGGAFLFSEYRNDSISASSQANDNSNFVITPQIATSTNEPIISDDNWQKTLSSAASSSSWLNSTDDDDSGYFDPGETVSGVTAFLGKDLFARFIAAKENGYDTSASDTQQYIVGQTLSDGTVLSLPKTYDKSDFSIKTDNSTTSIKAYADDVGRVFKTYLSPTQRNELLIVQDSLNNDDPTILKELDPIISSYQLVIKGLLGIQVPSAVADFHKDLINAMSEMTFVDQGLSETYSDGITSLQGIGMFQKSSLDLRNALYTLANYFATIGVTFGPNDSGSIFTMQTQ